MTMNISDDWWNGLPVTVEELISHVGWLTQRVQALEATVAALQAQPPGLSGLRKVEYKIQRLYVRQLSGTLNIGITSIGPETKMTDIPALEALKEQSGVNGLDLTLDEDTPVELDELDADWA